MKAPSASTAFLVAAILFAGLALTITITAQTSPSPSYQMPVWNPAAGESGAYVYPTLGPHLTITTGPSGASQVDANPIAGPAGPIGPPGPASATVPTKRDVLLSYDASKGGWTAPDAAIGNVGVYVNGLRYHQGTDFSLAGNVIVPIATGGAFDAAYLVTADYDLK